MVIDGTPLYIDIKELHKLLYRAQFTMTKGDRIVMGDRLLDLNQNMIILLSRAVQANGKERVEWIEKLRGEFDALRLCFQTAADLTLFKEARSTVDRNSGERTNIGPLVLGIVERIDKIDKGIGKWRSATKARIMP